MQVVGRTLLSATSPCTNTHTHAHTHQHCCPDRHTGSHSHATPGTQRPCGDIGDTATEIHCFTIIKYSFFRETTRQNASPCPTAAPQPKELCPWVSSRLAVCIPRTTNEDRPTLEPCLHAPALGEVPPDLSPQGWEQLGDILASHPMALVHVSPLRRLHTSSHPQLGKETPIPYNTIPYHTMAGSVCRHAAPRGLCCTRSLLGWHCSPAAIPCSTRILNTLFIYKISGWLIHIPCPPGARPGAAAPCPSGWRQSLHRGRLAKSSRQFSNSAAARTHLPVGGAERLGRGEQAFEESLFHNKSPSCCFFPFFSFKNGQPI